MSMDGTIQKELRVLREQSRSHEENLIQEAKHVLNKGLFRDEKILQNLKQYQGSFEKLDEEELPKERVFRIEEIRKLAIGYRLKFLESKLYKLPVPYETVLRIGALNEEFRKELKHFYILALPEHFRKEGMVSESLLFAKTNDDNYYLVDSWGKKINARRRWSLLPLRSFESLVITILLTTLSIALVLPTNLITLDPKAEYWSGYRAAAFFHLLIFDLGVTAYITFAFGKNFSSSIWNKYRDFD